MSRRVQPRFPERAPEELIRSLAEGLAHHLGTPLSVVLGRAEMILSGEVSGGEVNESVVAIRSKADEMHRVIDALLTLGRRQEPSRCAVNIRDLLSHVASLLQPHAMAAGVDIVVIESAGTPTEAMIDADQIQLALSNLVHNGIDALIEAGGEVTLRAEMTEPETLKVSVCDDGVGIPGEIIPRIFDPFFTSRPIDSGLGLGLSIAEAIVDDHGGRITVESEVGKGSSFTVHLPMEFES